MISYISFLLLHGFIQAATTRTTTDSSNLHVDLKLEVLLPVCGVAILAIVALFLCYYFYNKEDFKNTEYQRMPDAIEEYHEAKSVVPEISNWDLAPEIQMENIEDTCSTQSSFFHEERKYAGIKSPVGLHNFKNECYMNCIIQAIASSDKILNEFLQIKSFIPKSRILEKFLKLMDGVNNKNNSSTVSGNTAVLKSLNHEIGWTKSSQQDSFDFLSALMNAIHKDMKKANVKINLPLKFELFHKLTGFSLDDKVQYHMGLSIGLSGNYQRPPGVYLEDLIKEHLASTMIDEDSMKTTQMYFYKKCPDILTLHIQANKWDPIQEEMVKPEYYIKYDDVLSFETTIIKDLVKKERFVEQVTYKLMALVNHIGEYSSGHYFTYRNFKNHWFLANDEQIQKVEFDNKICPYILIYEKL